jgi:hypothetical protein
MSPVVRASRPRASYSNVRRTLHRLVEPSELHAIPGCGRRSRRPGCHDDWIDATEVVLLSQQLESRARKASVRGDCERRRHEYGRPECFELWIVAPNDHGRARPVVDVLEAG